MKVVADLQPHNRRPACRRRAAHLAQRESEVRLEFGLVRVDTKLKTSGSGLETHRARMQPSCMHEGVAAKGADQVVRACEAASND